ncbi:MAG: MBL fold metallo-hydrolase [Deltaproteobacteria bacterium]|nr:MBL fold metallo-hydrolase [Deltaproteobacteria bacterium]
MLVECLNVGPLDVNCYIVSCERTRQTLIVDPGGDADRITAFLVRKGLEPMLVVNTHGHFDHVGGNAGLLRRYPVSLGMHRADLPVLAALLEMGRMFNLELEPSPQPTMFLEDNAVLEVGDLKFRVLHTPGHSPGSICLLAGNVLFSGDTLFADGVGRTDLPGGSAEQLRHSLYERLLKLPDETVVYPGHGPETTIRREKLKLLAEHHRSDP